MSGRRALVFLDGEYAASDWHARLAASVDLVLAADGGARAALAAGARPAAVVGDFDSLDPGSAAQLAAAGVELIRHPVRKDQTDGELAAEEALRRGADEVLLAGATGALDHTLGHLALLLRLARRGVRARLVAPHESVAVLVAPAAARLGATAGTRVSLVPLAGDAVVTLRGLEYPLERGRLPVDACLGLGNAVAASGPATVAVHEGAVAVLVADGGEAFTAAADAAAPARRARLRQAAWAWAAVIAVSGVLPTQGAVHALAEGHDSLATTVGHGLAYALLAVLMAGAAGWRLRPAVVLRVLLVAAVLGGAVEVVQAPLPYRDCQAVDLLVDVAGAAAGLALVSASVARPGRGGRPRGRRG